MKKITFLVTFVALVTQCLSESILTDSLGLENLVQGIDSEIKLWEMLPSTDGRVVKASD